MNRCIFKCMEACAESKKTPTLMQLMSDPGRSKALCNKNPNIGSTFAIHPKNKMGKKTVVRPLTRLNGMQRNDTGDMWPRWCRTLQPTKAEMAFLSPRFLSWIKIWTVHHCSFPFMGLFRTGSTLTDPVIWSIELNPQTLFKFCL